MKKNFKTWLCSVLVLGTTLSISLFAAGCGKDDFKNKIDQAFCEHNYGAVATEVKAATCTAEGEEVWTCIECGKEKTIVLEKIDHDFTAPGGWTKQKQAPTCREEGIQESRCGVCKTIVTQSIEKLPHVEVEVEEKAPTCTVAGHTEYSYCSVCNDFITPKVTIPALGHNVEVVKGYEATCDNKGLTDGKVCLDCDEVLTEQKEIPALGHKIEYLAPVEPTCEMTGLTAGYACERCDKVYTAQNVVEKLPHVDEDGDTFCDDCGSIFLTEKSLIGATYETVGGETLSGWYRMPINSESISVSGKGNVYTDDFNILGASGTFTFSFNNGYISLEETVYAEQYDSWEKLNEDIFSVYGAEIFAGRISFEAFVINDYIYFYIPNELKVEVSVGFDLVDESSESIVGDYKISFSGSYDEVLEKVLFK